MILVYPIASGMYTKKALKVKIVLSGWFSGTYASHPEGLEDTLFNHKGYPMD